MHDADQQKLALKEHARVLRAHCPGWSLTFTQVHPEFWGQLRPVIEQEVVQAGL